MLRYAISDRIRFPGDEQNQRSALLRQAAKLGREGVNFFQLREKSLEPAKLADLARGVLAAFRQSGSATKLLINSRADVAVAVAADGVHLTAEAGGLTPADVRLLYRERGLAEPVVSVSCHSLEEVSRARRSGADLIVFGPVFEKRIFGGDGADLAGLEVGKGMGLGMLRLACFAAGNIPVVAMGGITEKTAAACREAGAAGVASIRLFL